MRIDKNCILIAGGGSGGHIFPGLAVADYLIKKKDWKVYWLGSFGHLEADIVPKSGIEIRFIHAIGFCGNKWYRKLVSLLYLCISILRSWVILRDWKPDVVLCVGGYVSVAVGIAAWFYGCPVVLHEQNSIAGFSNRFLSMTIAKKVLQALPGAFLDAEIVGNPIRDTILSIQNPEDRLSGRDGPIRLLVIGGSQGARIFNNILPKIILRLSSQFIVWHQVGKGNLKKMSYVYSSNAVENIYKLVEFIDDISIAYTWADMVICRSGALTVSEISSVGLAAIFVPFLHKDYHQYWNAFPLQQIGAAKIVSEKEFTVSQVVRILRDWNCRSFLLKMAKRSKILSVPDATERVVCNIINQITS